MYPASKCSYDFLFAMEPAGLHDHSTRHLTVKATAAIHIKDVSAEKIDGACYKRSAYFGLFGDYRW